MNATKKNRSVYIGIDVAFAKKKRLPISVCEIIDGQFTALRLRREFDKPPAGRGNKAALDESQVKEYAELVVQWVRKLQKKQSLSVVQIAIDAPSNYCLPHLTRRLSEQALDKAGISCFATPTKTQFDEKISNSLEHLKLGGKLSRLPNANQLWMLVGFALFDALTTAGFDCVETYPQAIVHELKCSSQHKSTSEGLKGQIERVGAVLGYSKKELTALLATMGYGSRHDKLDALLSAWVASLPKEHRKVFGAEPDDAIVVPNMDAIGEATVTDCVEATA